MFDGFLEAHYFTAQNIYVAYMDRYEEVMSKWNEYVEDYKQRIDELIGLVDERLKNIFVPILVTTKATDDFISKGYRVLDRSPLRLSPIVKEMNVLIKRNNVYSSRLDIDKQKARNSLRLDFVCSYCKDIKYAEEASRIQKEHLGMINWACDLGDMFKKIGRLEAQIEQKELEKKDESLAAMRVTNLLANHFGNGSLSLEPEVVKGNVITANMVTFMPTRESEPPKKTKFVVKRGGQYAKNLSEGEKSLISFCYFIAQMENELAGPDAGKLVVYIDDPISSLDSSHIFFMYSLIDSVIVRPTTFGQLFISTHNLEFLKYMKRINMNAPKGSRGISKYVVVKLGKGATDKYRSEIRTMPEYLSKYVTEYNFLFEQIYKVASLESDEDQALYGEQYTLYYNIGNNMRKFLECYLFNRYPNADDPLVMHLKDLFNENVPSEVNRVVNEYSHLAWAERGMKVMDVPEVVTAARQILKALQTKDKEHYDTLCRSVKVDEKTIF